MALKYKNPKNFSKISTKHIIFFYPLLWLTDFISKKNYKNSLQTIKIVLPLPNYKNSLLCILKN